MASGAPPKLPIRRNTVILSATMAVNSAVLQLVAAVSSLTFVLVTGVRGLLGLGPAIFLTSSGLTAVPAGRLMDRVGRTPVMTFGFAVAAGGCALTALATRTESTLSVIAGFALVGASSGIALLIRTAAGDMYPPERRARGISYVLFGSVFGAILGPTVLARSSRARTSRPTRSRFRGSPPEGSLSSPSLLSSSSALIRSESPSSSTAATTPRPLSQPRRSVSSSGDPASFPRWLQHSPVSV